MKKYLFYILLLIIFSCDSLDETGLEEHGGNYNYYDFVAYGWSEFFNGNYDLSLSYFDQALLINDVDGDGSIDNMHHSAYVGISWSTIYNIISSLSDNNNITTNELIEEAIKPMCYYIDSESEWNLTGDCNAINLIDVSDNVASDFYNILENLNGITFCEQDYCCYNCFSNDKKVSFIYYYAYKYYYYYSINDMQNSELFYNVCTYYALNFLSSTNSISNLDMNDSYDLKAGKPDNLPQFTLNRNNIIVLLAQIYLKNQEYNNAATILYNGDICADSIGDPDESINVQSIIDCVDSFDL